MVHSHACTVGVLKWGAFQERNSPTGTSPPLPLNSHVPNPWTSQGFRKLPEKFLGELPGTSLTVDSESIFPQVPWKFLRKFPRPPQCCDIAGLLAPPKPGKIQSHSKVTKQ